MSRLRVFAIASLSIGAMVSSALADGVVTLQDPGATWRAIWNGGPFQVNRVSGYNGEGGGPGATAPSFLTFCVELNEFVSLNNSTQYNTHIALSAVGGGGGAVNGEDALDSLTASLYREFRGANSFGGTNAVGLGGDGISSATETQALQRAIWYIEQEASDFAGDSLAQDFYDWAVSNNTGIGNVRVLRLYNRNANGSDGGNAQDLLTIIPLPPAAWAGLATLAGVGAFGRIRRHSLRA